MPDSETFMTRLEQRARAANSLLCVGLDPHPSQLPENTAEAALAFCTRLVDATHETACAFKPNSAFFEALGGPGVEALRALIAHIRAADPSIPVILDAKRGDIASTAEAYARAAFDVLGADAITLSPYLGKDSVTPFLAYPGRGAFVLCRTSNPGAGDLQDLPVNDGMLFEAVAASVQTWDEGGALGLVAGATDVRALERARAAAPTLWLLVPGIGAQGGDLQQTVEAARRADGLGFLINVSRSLSQANDPRAEAEHLRDAINEYRAAPPPVPAGTPGPLARLADALFDAGCIRFGAFRLKSGVESPIYLDLRRLVGSPESLRVVAMALTAYIREQQLGYAHFAAIPYAALPIATVAAQHARASLVYPRRETKDYGTRAAVEGVFQPGDVAVLLDDLATTGESKFEAIDKLIEAGLTVRDIVVVIDREQGARPTLEEAGYRFHALITLTGLLNELERLGRLSPDKRREIDLWLRAQRSES